MISDEGGEGVNILHPHYALAHRAVPSPQAILESHPCRKTNPPSPQVREKIREIQGTQDPAPSLPCLVGLSRPTQSQERAGTVSIASMSGPLLLVLVTLLGKPNTASRAFWDWQSHVLLKYLIFEDLKTSYKK